VAKAGLNFLGASHLVARFLWGFKMQEQEHFLTSELAESDSDGVLEALFLTAPTKGDKRQWRRWTKWGAALLCFATYLTRAGLRPEIIDSILAQLFRGKTSQDGAPNLPMETVLERRFANARLFKIELHEFGVGRDRHIAPCVEVITEDMTHGIHFIQEDAFLIIPAAVIHRKLLPLGIDIFRDPRLTISVQQMDRQRLALSGAQ